MNPNTSIRALFITGCLIMFGVSAIAQSNDQSEVTETSPSPPAIQDGDDQRSADPKVQETNVEHKADGAEVICKKRKKEGTRLRKKKVCKTKTQWEAERLAIRDDLDAKTRGAYTGS